MEKNFKNLIKKFDSLDDIKMLQVNFIMIYTIHKISVSLKINRITLRIVFSNTLLRTIIDFHYFFEKNKYFLSQPITDERFNA